MKLSWRDCLKIGVSIFVLYLCIHLWPNAVSLAGTVIGAASPLILGAMIAYVVFGKQLFMIFSDDPAVHEMSGTFVKAILWMFPALAVMRGTGAFIQGIGNAKFSMVLALLDGVVLRIGLSWLFGIVLNWGFYGFVLGYALAPYGYAIPSFFYFISGKWQRKKALAEDI